MSPDVTSREFWFVFYFCCERIMLAYGLILFNALLLTYRTLTITLYAPNTLYLGL